MDESLLEFKENKKICKGPKEAKKPSAKPTIRQPKRAAKKGKGQKDIRTALKPKKDDLVSYSKEFRNVCLESGVDVDSEQLQIAIALSKSLKEFESPPTQAGTSQSQKPEEFSGKNRSGKIRSTLLQYGFSVPVIRKTIEIKRKVKKYRKNSKLLIVTEDEKKQKISDKVSQILLDFNSEIGNISITAETRLHTDKKANLYQLTGEKFALLIDDKCFYTGDLLEFAPNTAGCLLKDWSKIPGRPMSPQSVVINNEHFTEFIDNQDDLDVLLSGTMEVVKRFVGAIKREKNVSAYKNREEPPKMTMAESEDKQNVQNKHTLEMITPVSVRSCSPDLFEDDPSIVDITFSLSHTQTVKSDTKMVAVTSSLPDQSSDNLLTGRTKRRYDFMDFTECVSSNMSKFVLQNSNCRIDLTNYPNDTDQNTLLVFSDNNADTSVKDIGEIDNNQNSQTFDLTQSSESSLDSLPCVNLPSQSRKHTLSPEIAEEESNGGNSISLNINDHEHHAIPLGNKSDNCIDENDISLTKGISPEICDKNEITTGKSELFVDFNFHHTPSRDNCSIIQLQDIEMNRGIVMDHEGLLKGGDDNIDLTQSSNSHDVDNIENEDLQNVETDLIQVNNSPVTEILSLDYSCNFNEESEDRTIEYENYEDGLKENHIFDNRNETFKDISDIPIELDLSGDRINILHERSSHSSKDNSAATARNDDALKSSQSSVNVFEISDEELNYSMQYFKKRKSKCLNDPSSNSNRENANFDLGGSSILDQIPSNRPSTSNCFTPNKSSNIDRLSSKNIPCDDSFLPAVEIKGTRVKIKSPEPKGKNDSTPLTPLRRNETCTVVTPSNTEYIVKTNNITPMTNYTSIDTPELNRELDKFGIKPIKRKRAVQLLEHLYYQTHPMVEHCGTEAPPKKPRVHVGQAKTSTDSQNASNQLENEQIKKNDEGEINNENAKMYEVDNERPMLQNIPCNSEDWIFQKKEKAKVHSCRVPLHIAFHNYLNARLSLRAAVLRYEPVSIDTIHKQLVKDGYRYDPKELLKFMDKKCITVKTSDNNGRNCIRRSQRKS